VRIVEFGLVLWFCRDDRASRGAPQRCTVHCKKSTLHKRYFRIFRGGV